MQGCRAPEARGSPLSIPLPRIPAPRPRGRLPKRPTDMKWLKILGVVIAVIALVCIAGSFMLPKKWSVERSRDIDATPEAIHAYVGNFDTWSEWNEFEIMDDSVKVLPLEGEPTEVGTVRRWTSKSGAGSMTMTATDPQKGVSFDLAMEGFPTFEGRISYAEVDGKTRVMWTDHGEVRDDILGRWFGAAMGPMIGGTIDKCLENLANKVE